MPFLPILFSVGTNGKITIGLNRKLVTPLGDVIVGGDNVIKPDGKPLRLEPADVTQLVICQNNDPVIQRRYCEAYQIGTGRKIIDAAPGVTIKLTDSGPPAKLEAFGPARIDVEEFHFQEAGDETEVDLERSRSGTATDLSYDHISGEMKPIHGAKISLYSTWGGWTSPGKRSDYPGEQECLQKPPADWRDAFSIDDLNADHSIFVSTRRRATSGSCSSNPTRHRNQLPTMCTRLRGSADHRGEGGRLGGPDNHVASSTGV
jgi:hypothetical protein